MTTELRIISSMATKAVLAELAALYERQGGPRVEVVSVGGVDAAKRVQAGEAFDAAVLASNAIDKLMSDGKAVAGSRVDIVRSGVAVAVRAGAAQPEIGSEAALMNAVLAARTVGYSTGPSGVQLAALFERWGIARALEGKLVQAPPGVPVGSLVASGEVELGFQQLSELMSLPGISVVGPLPDAVQIVTTFSGAVVSAGARPEAARELLAFMASPTCTAVKLAGGMEAAS